MPSQNQTNTYGSWTDCGPLSDQEHIRSVINPTGCHAVLKKPRRKGQLWLARFEEEARGMAALTAGGQTGNASGFKAKRLSVGSVPGCTA